MIKENKFMNKKEFLKEDIKEVKDPFLEKLETLINKMENIKSDFENSDTNS
jgi:hypothetical protein